MRKKVTDVKKIEKTDDKINVLELIGKGLCGITAILLFTCSYINYCFNNDNNISSFQKKELVFASEIIENTNIGFDDINIFNSSEIDKDDFVILNIGNHNTQGTMFLYDKLEKCNKENISVGLVVNSEAISLEDIYNDIELVKGILYSYDIDYPVYLNIDEIIENNDLVPDMKSEIIRAFLEKCSSNGIYVGIQGKNSNIKVLREKLKIENYDIFLLDECNDNNIKYVESFICDDEIISKKDYSNIIKKDNLNNSSKFVSDACHIVSDGESILDISYKYNISAEEILSYNNISENDLKFGKKIRIPNRVGVTMPNIFSEYKDVEIPIKGCNISEKIEDLDYIKDNYDFVLLNIFDDNNMGNSYEINIKNCNLKGIPVGIFCDNVVKRVSLCDDTFITLFENQADKVIEKMNNKKIDYPVYLSLGENIKENYSKEDIRIILDIWIIKILNAGYEPGLYCSVEDFKYINDSVDYDLQDEFSLWILTNEIKRSFDVESKYNDKVFINEYDADIVQVENNSYSFVDYDNEIYNDWIAEFPIKESVQELNNTKKALLVGGLGITIIPGIFIGKRILKSLKIRK